MNNQIENIKKNIIPSMYMELFKKKCIYLNDIVFAIFGLMSEQNLFDNQLEVAWIIVFNLWVPCDRSASFRECNT